jgi:TatD DNase family protein
VYKLIDTHAHLDELSNIDYVFEEAREQGVIAIIAVGSDQSSNEKVLSLANKYPGFVLPALGLHPWQLLELGSNEVNETIKFIEENMEHAIAIGEIGLDYQKKLIKKVPKEYQKEVMLRLLKLALSQDVPAIIHSRYAWKDAFSVTREAGARKAVFHWFTGFSSTLQSIIDSGYYISATPAAEYHEEHRRAVKAVPIQQLLLETDSPVTYGREERYRATPATIIRSLRAAAQLQGKNQDMIAKKTTENTIRLFSLSILI